MNILMVAVENGALPGGKVGGMGDVIRDIPVALAELGHAVDVVMPGYQHFSRLPGARFHGAVQVRFGRGAYPVEVFLLEQGAVRCWILEHPLLAPCKPGQIYCNDPAHRPFATDASKFAFFSAAVCEALLAGMLGQPDVIHLHDWHVALVAVLARFDPHFWPLRDCRLVYTIHNLALQGIRPFAGDESALETWFPYLQYDRQRLVDPRYGDCVNPMRAAINLCDRIHTVSPTYALEIQRPNEPAKGFHGGEGLEADLRKAQVVGKLVGILNGCVYGDGGETARLPFSTLLVRAEQQVLRWIAASEFVPSASLLALKRIAALRTCAAPAGVLTSVGRLTGQKMAILMETLADGRSCAEHLLDRLPAEHLLIILGSGDPAIEQFFTGLAARYDNFLFLKGFAETLSEDLYRLGDLFLMPSSFEPCGISQMLAMRAGQPCLVHGVGGLADTVIAAVDGFVFNGDGPRQQAEAFVELTISALGLRQSNPAAWSAIAGRAAAKRFLWRDSAQRYCAELYTG